jgi:hypothetical protein
LAVVESCHISKTIKKYTGSLQRSPDGLKGAVVACILSQ